MRATSSGGTSATSPPRPPLPRPPNFHPSEALPFTCTSLYSSPHTRPHTGNIPPSNPSASGASHHMMHGGDRWRSAAAAAVGAAAGWEAGWDVASPRGGVSLGRELGRVSGGEVGWGGISPGGGWSVVKRSVVAAPVVTDVEISDSEGEEEPRRPGGVGGYGEAGQMRGQVESADYAGEGQISSSQTRRASSVGRLGGRGVGGGGSEGGGRGGGGGGDLSSHPVSNGASDQHPPRGSGEARLRGGGPMPDAFFSTLPTRPNSNGSDGAFCVSAVTPVYSSGLTAVDLCDFLLGLRFSPIVFPVFCARHAA